MLIVIVRLQSVAMVNWLHVVVVSQQTSLPMKVYCAKWASQSKLVLYGHIEPLSVATVLANQNSVDTHLL